MKYVTHFTFLALLVLPLNAELLTVLDKSTPSDAGLSKAKLAILAQTARGEARQQLPEEVRVMSEENTIALLQDLGVDLATCEGQCEVDVARKLKADWLLSLQIVRFADTWNLQLNWFEAASGDLRGSTRRQATEEAGLLAAVEDGVRSIIPHEDDQQTREAQFLDMMRAQGLSETEAQAELERAKVGSWASDAKVQINAILNAALIYEQETGAWPANIAALEREGFVEIDAETSRLWVFELLDGQWIQATSTALMQGGAGQVVQFDRESGSWRGYGFEQEATTDGE